MNNSGKLLLVIMLTVLGFSQLFGAAGCWIERTNGDSSTVLVGDTLNLAIKVNTHGEKITGYAFYISVDPDIFKPIINTNGEPFKRGTFIASPAPLTNSTHGDVWGNDPMSNLIPGFQLDYEQLTETASGGVRPSVSGLGTAATFKLIVIGVPDDPSNPPEIGFDDQHDFTRETGYFNVNAPGTDQRFGYAYPFRIGVITAFRISPAIRDTLIAPGTSLQINLNQHISGNIDPADVTWTHTTLEPLENTSLSINNENNILSFTSQASAQGVLKIQLHASDDIINYTQDQNLSIAVDYKPEFKDPLPTVQFNEDEEYEILMSDLFTDQDDQGTNFLVWTEDINVFAEATETGSVVFSADTNWYGSKNVNVHVQDPLQQSVGLSSIVSLPVVVNSVNDAPVLDFSSTNNVIILYHYEVKNVDLLKYVSDVDGDEFIWHVNNSDPNKLDAVLSSNSLLLSTLNEEFYGDIPITITVEDNEGDQDSKNVTIRVSTFPPVAKPFGDITMMYDEIYSINLNNYVQDPDSPLDVLQWSFRAYDYYTRKFDQNVTTVYVHESQQLQISATDQHSAFDKLMAVVTDNVGNADTTIARLAIFNSFAPMTLQIPQFVMVTDTAVQAIDLDSLVLDPQDNPENIQWKVEGINNLKNVTIDGFSHIVTVESNETFLGTDTVFFIATNSQVLSDTTSMIVQCVSRSTNPVIISMPDQTFYWKVVAPQRYLDLDNYVWDYVTPVSEIEWEIVYNTNIFDVIQGDDNVISIQTYSQTGEAQVIFTAFDQDGYSASDTVLFSITEDTAPVWDPLEDVSIPKNGELTLYSLQNKCYDDITPSSELKFNFETETVNRLNISINPIVTLSLKDTTYTEKTWIRFSATDEHGHQTWSDTVKVSVRQGEPPEWQQIPTIQFNNNETYTNLYLSNYCSDPEGGSLAYTAVCNHSGLSVTIDQSTSQVTFTPQNGFYGNLSVIFKATDIDNNTVSTISNLIIKNTLPPEGYLSYYYNPVTSQRLNLLVTSDASVTSMTPSFTVNSQSASMAFNLIDSDVNKKIWTAAYMFEETGSYFLKVEFENTNGIKSSDSLSWTINLGKLAKGQFNSYDNKLVVDYTSNGIEKENYFLLMQSYENKNEKIHKKVESPVYKIHSTLNHDGLLIATYNQKRADDPYYAFYKLLDNGRMERIDTYTDKNGNFQAIVDLNNKYVFSKCELAASAQSIPFAELQCYPNPFNAIVKIKFLLQRDQREGRVSVFNILGQLVYTRDLGEIQSGIHTLDWNGLDKNGNVLPSGVYFMKVKCGNENSLIRKVTLIK